MNRVAVHTEGKVSDRSDGGETNDELCSSLTFDVRPAATEAFAFLLLAECDQGIKFVVDTPLQLMMWVSK